MWVKQVIPAQTDLQVQSCKQTIICKLAKTQGTLILCALQRNLLEKDIQETKETKRQ